jgi:hypothetical protein
MKQRIIQFLICVLALSMLAGLAHVLANPEVIMGQYESKSTCSNALEISDTIQADKDTTHLQRTDFARSGHKEK